MPRLRNEIKSNDELAGVSLIDLKNEYKKLKTKYDKINSGFFCHDCNRFLPADKFYVSSKWKSGVIPTCRECLNKIALGFNEKTEKTNETEETFKEALRIAKLPFLRKEYNSAVATLQDTTNGARRISTFQQYMGVIQSLPQYKDMRWEDGDFEAAEEVEEEKEVKLSKEKKKIAQKRFGLGYTDGEYAYLENEYEDWAATYTIENKAQEKLFTRICCKDLEIHKAEINGEDTKELDKTLQELMTSLNIKPSQRNASAMTDNKVFGQLIDDWEQHDPIPEPSEKFKDVDNIAKYIHTFFYGHLAKMMGLKNAYSRLYEKWIKEYSVEKNVYEEDQDSEEIFDKLFGSLGDDIE